MRTRTLLVLAGSGAVVLGLAMACKREAVETVTLDLGLENGGSLGFACTEDRSAICSAILNCALRPAARDVVAACVSALCTDGGVTNRDCTNTVLCVRDGGTVGDCYNATCSSQHPLIDRAADGKGGADVHLIVDYIGLGGTPGCRGSELRGWCAAHACRPIRRACVPLHLDAAALASPGAVTKSIAAGFGAQRTLDTDAPDAPVLVRIVGVARSGACTADEEAPAQALTAPVIGCAYSCPTVLSANHGDLTVDFDVPGSKCTDVELADCITIFADAGGP